MNLVYGVDEDLGGLAVRSGGGFLHERHRGQIYRQSIRNGVQVSGHYPNIYEQGTTPSMYITV